MKHIKYQDRKSFKKHGLPQVQSTPTHRNVVHQFTGMKPFNQTIKLKPQ